MRVNEFFILKQHFRGLPGGLVVKILLLMQEMRVWCLGQEDPQEREMVTHSSIPAWEIPWTEQPGGPQSKGSQRVVPILAIKQQKQHNIINLMEAIYMILNFLIITLKK